MIKIHYEMKNQLVGKNMDPTKKLKLNWISPPKKCLHLFQKNFFGQPTKNN